MSRPAPATRIAGVRDLPALLDLVQSAYRGAASRAGWTTEDGLLGGQRTDARAVTALLVSVRDQVLVLDDDRGALACCAVGARDGTGTFGMFAVRPGAQGRGTGRAVLAAAEAHVTARWAVPRLEMTVIEQRTELIAWYERRGYARTGRTRPFPYGDERFGIPRRPDLRFAVLARQLP